MLLTTLLFFSFVECYCEFSALAHLKPKVSDDVQTVAVRKLLMRLIPNRYNDFLIKVDRSILQYDKDAFQLQKLENGSVLIIGSTGVSAATGFNHYLKYYCFGQVSWQTSNINLPKELPHINLTVVCKDRFRYYQNVCTASYSFVWWTWEDWEKHIDWMALYSYNLVLAFNGLEAIWKRVYLKLNLTDEEISEHFAGPAFLAWGRMGNIRGWGGPLPESWHSKSVNLQHRILRRMREFGILPVLPGFAGHVPRAFKRLFPNAKLSPTPNWNRFNDTYCCPLLLEPTELLFQTVTSMFMEELINEFETDHVYGCDTFNEMVPSNGSTDYIRNMGQLIYSAMSANDPKAIWLMQGWLFIHEIIFWTDSRIEALLTSVPQGKMIVLDLQSEQHPLYTRLKSFYGQPFIWCMLHDFGGTLGMFGSAKVINEEVHNARNMTNSTMIGTGLTPEGINQNYVIYELMSESSWRSESINLTEWFSLYTIRRYGHSNPEAIKAWQILKNTVYNFDSVIPIRGKYVLTRKPSTRIEPWIWYDKCELLRAWDYLLQAVNLQNNEGYRHDIVDLTRQVLQVLIDDYYQKLRTSFRQRKRDIFQKESTIFLDAFVDVETILKTNKAFLLGNWLNAAKKVGSDSNEKRLYEYNARNQITLWGPNGEITDYANKQWSGMISDYYLPRWRVFVNAMNESLINQEPFNESKIAKIIFQDVEESFTHSQKEFPDCPSGDSIKIAREIRNKWWNLLHSKFTNDNNNADPIVCKI